MAAEAVDHEAVARTIISDGYAVVQLPQMSELLTQLDEEVERLLHKSRPAPPNLFSGLKTRRYFGLLSEAPVWQEVATQTDVLQIVQRVLGRGFLLSLLSTALIEPGESHQELHTDDDVYGLPRPQPPLVVNTIWALSDFNRENGATRLVPGSHAMPGPLPEDMNSCDAVACEVPRGAIIFILGSMIHGGGANRTSARRNGLVVNYCARHLRQHENLLLGLSPESVSSFPRRLRALLGCLPEGPGLGVAAPSVSGQLLRRARSRSRRRR